MRRFMRGTMADGVALGMLPSTQVDQRKNRAQTQVAHRGLGGVLGEARRGRDRGESTRADRARRESRVRPSISGLPSSCAPSSASTWCVGTTPGGWRCDRRGWFHTSKQGISLGTKGSGRKQEEGKKSTGVRISPFRKKSEQVAGEVDGDCIQ
jgi:hypothetical protein